METIRRLLLIIFVLCAANGIAESLDAHSGEESDRTAFITPCSSWQYNMDARGYICRFTGTRMEIAEARELRYEFNRLNQTIRDLEARVRQLESKTP